jgi:hypothetical protein
MVCLLLGGSGGRWWMSLVALRARCALSLADWPDWSDGAGRGRVEEDVSELVTGEAVALGMQPARLPSRALAIVARCHGRGYSGVYFVLSVGLLAATASLDEAASAARCTSPTFLLVLVGGPIAVETLSAGGRSGSWPAGCGWCATTAGRSGSGTRWCGARWVWSRSC